MTNTQAAANTRRQPVQERAVKRRARIIEGAMEVIATDGIDALNMRDIAKAADVGIGTLYDYFPSRSDLICHVTDAWLTRKLSVFDATIATVSKDDKFRNFIVRYRKAMQDAGFGTPFDSEISRAAANDKKVAAIIDDYRSEAIERYTQVLQHAGSTWTERQLRPVSRFLLQLSEQVEPATGFEGTAEDRVIVGELIAQTIVSTLKRTLQPR
jgi:AcrR family transcriptional regulator